MLLKLEDLKDSLIGIAIGAFSMYLGMTTGHKLYEENEITSNHFQNNSNMIQTVRYDNNISKVEINSKDYLQCKAINHLNDALTNSHVSFPKDHQVLETILKKNLKLPTGNNEADAQKILSFVQGLDYISDVKGYVKHPVETLVEGGGDCEDLSALAYCLMKDINLDPVLIQFPVNDQNIMHVAVGVPGNFEGIYLTHNDKKYFIAEATATSLVHDSLKMKIGDYPNKDSYDLERANFYTP